MRAKISAVWCGDLSCGVDDFGQAGAEGAVMVDAGVAEVFEGEVGEALGGGGGSEGAALDLRRGVRGG